MVVRLCVGLLVACLSLAASAEPVCRYGQLEASSMKRLANHEYMAVQQGSQTYIHIQVNPPVYVKQDSHQYVTATAVESLPAQVQRLFVETIRDRTACMQAPLYLSSILPAK